MKRFSLLIMLLFLMLSCESDDSENVIMKHATISIDESESDNCLYSIITEDNEFFTTDNLPSEYSENTFEARITYQMTEERGDCGFGGFQLKIRILNLVKL